ncbi:Lipoprotein OS=Tsukamurella paurometabola (strain ATCC 8368 / DSM / CCUG 35730 / CIP 100753/ JCM 10117 / KCTC 9821 / NBRC 16120 / NCIMB 702349 / NCTC 13040)OX=521096 GN=Tpau_2630 PE=4 SV=1 [Tsukamurella paurometabola]|uniref:Low molecular weight antigen MTB12-like C-terminal domain-containing protein n=1 Tax=Tsukamurella paurometabola (strain ATCC 8368 / DSM 20162 / CCUG 35730 / CIP 100753 / JCM 10117 / KCTC 9821 / NBRC 16120 / NCIMB 702349 / NCTC 13040) TaxID=521096 RepID=D5USG0_TSUPD|nr:hypothetical protein [Tsukamurella paurometabola]ADG79231.1 conserved hypothetical protein [Tsukamurella paurometabola DSM 20162]SUP34668.1 Uncharacterised protein [Tsukamurella paurometabola]
MSATRTVLVPVIAVAGLIGGCASENADAPPSPMMTTTLATVAEAPSTTADRAPSAAQIEAMLERAVDPNVPSTAKVDLVQGATDADAPLFDELVRLRQSNPQFTWHIGKPVLEQPGLSKAPVSGLVGGANQTAYATFVFEDTWKLQRDYACDIVAQVGRSAPSCG